MPTQDVALTVVRIGLATQFATTLLLVLLFGLLRRQARRRRYFYYWFAGWGFLAVGLTALLVRFFFISGPIGEQPADNLVERVFTGLYQFGKVGFLAGVLVGTLDYTRGIRSGLAFRAALGLALIFGVVCARFAESLDQTLLWQVPFTAIAFLGSAGALLGLSPYRRSLGTRLTAYFLVLFALAWLLYGFIFGADLVPGLESYQPWMMQVALYNAHIDLLLQMLVAFGMVVILLEDAKRETEAAHGELAVAHQELKAESLRDSLTRALNRRAYNEGAGLEAARADFGTVIVFDLDNLKAVNDAHGHQAGDALLRYFVEVLRPRLRPGDKLFRFGGDEFLLVMPRARVEEVVKRFRELMEEVPPMPWGDGDRAVPLRVSIGAAAFRDGEQLESAISRADSDMYKEKRQHKLFDS